MIPKLPSWNKMPNKAIPPRLYVSPKSMVLNPVTLIVLTAVNKISMNERWTPGFWKIGKLNKIAATKTAIK